MTLRQLAGLAVLAAGLLLAARAPIQAQGKKSDSVVKAKATATPEKPGGDGKQVVTIVLEIDPSFHLYANPVGNEDLVTSQTTVTVTAKAKPQSVKVEYPPGEVKADKVVGDYKIFKDKVTIKATVVRAKGDTSPLEVAVKLQACDKSRCLLPATVKLKVP
jgi:hypothetical protein